MKTRRADNIGIREKITVIKPSWEQYSLEKELGASLWDNHSRYYGKKEEPATVVQTESSGPLLAVKEYCANSTLHGVKYITADNVYHIERILWFGCCMAAVTGAILFVLPVFQRYMDYRIITSVESTSTPIWDVPFPGVTICNINRAMANLIDERAKVPPWKYYKKEHFGNAIRLLSVLGQITLKSSADADKDVTRLLDRKANYTDELMTNVIQPLERMILKCIWLGEAVNCSDLFEIRRTDEGFCWGFNTKPMKSPRATEVDSDFSSTYGNENDTAYADSYEASASAEDIAYDHNLTNKIRRVNGAGPIMGLTVLLNPDSQYYFYPPIAVTGFKVLIHHPMDFPSVSSKSFLVSAGREVFAAVTPTQTYSTDQVKEIPRNKRDCYLEHDLALKYYTAYSYRNCLLECQIASMKRNCQCVPYLFSLLNNTKVCNYSGVLCINRNMRRFSSIQPKSPVLGLNTSVKSMKGCKCKSSCDETTYFTEVTTALYPNKPDEIQLPPDVEDVNTYELVLMRVFFKDMSFITYRRDLYYKWTDVISAFGGVVNLFIGFSFISVAELIYFFIVRPLFRRLMAKRFP